MNLRFDMWNDDNRHPQVIMQELGITYAKAIPQPIADQWIFMDCKKVPEKLPPFIKETGK